MATPGSSDPYPKTSRLDHGKHEVENECLSSNLWKRLPEHLIDEILVKLPFSSLVRFCSVCKRWRNLILTSEISPRCTFDHGRLFYYSNDGELKIFSSRRGTWEIAPLAFLEEEFDPFFDLVDVVASAGGLLCFCTSEYGEFVVCNPITKCYKRLQMPCGETLTSNGHPGMPRKFPEEWDDPHSLDLLVGMILNPDSGHFQIIVGRVYSRGTARTALLYDSSCNSWKKVASIPAGANLSKSRPICCGKNIFFFFVQRCFNGARILKYDSEEQSWRWIRIPEEEGFSSRIVNMTGNLVLMTGAYKKLGMVEFRVLQESGRWFHCRSQNYTRVSDSFPNIKLSDFYNQGDMLFLILKRTSGSPGFETGEVKVVFYNHTIRLTVTSDWEESGYKEDEFPECQIFKPSLMPIM